MQSIFVSVLRRGIATSNPQRRCHHWVPSSVWVHLFSWWWVPVPLKAKYSCTSGLVCGIVTNVAIIQFLALGWRKHMNMINCNLSLCQCQGSVVKSNPIQFNVAIVGPRVGFLAGATIWIWFSDETICRTIHANRRLLGLISSHRLTWCGKGTSTQPSSSNYYGI